MTVRTWLITTLTTWLVFTLARQIFDLIGRLWIPVGFNLLQLVCCITGLFGVCQKRFSLLVALAISTVFSMAQNVLMGLWYSGVLGERTKPILSGGLPYAFSFFLRFTPGCTAHFDLERSRWVQSSCAVPYYIIETVQAGIHILLALVTLILTIIYICQRRKEKQTKELPPALYSQVGRSKVLQAPSSINDISSGYMNSSYEEVSDMVTVHHDPPPVQKSPVLPRAAAARSYERKGSKKKKTKPRPNSMPQPNLEYSSAETDEVPPMPNSVRGEDFYTKPQKPRKSAMKPTAGGGRFKKAAEEQQRRATVHEAPSDYDLERGGVSRCSSANMTSLVSFDPKSDTLLRVREHLESEEDEESGRDGESRSQHYGRIRHQQEAAVDVGSVYERIKEKSRPSPSSRRPVEREMGAEQRVPLALTRHKNPSQDSVPSMIAPVLVSPQVSSCDSGLPGSSYDQWPPPPPKMDPWKNQLKKSPRDYASRDDLYSPGIRLSMRDLAREESPRDYPLSPGIRLTSQINTESAAATRRGSGDYRSAFQVQPRDNRIIGHYHSPGEFPLTDVEDEMSPTGPVISGSGLLV